MPYLLEDLRSATGASTGKSQQRFIRVYPKGTGEKDFCKKCICVPSGKDGRKSLLQETEDALQKVQVDHSVGKVMRESLHGILVVKEEELNQNAHGR